MDEYSIAYKDHNIKAGGKDDFNAFYRKNRSHIFRGEEGIEFPILYTGKKIIQGVGEILAFLKTEDKLNEFVKKSDLSHGWISGLNIFADSNLMEDVFLDILRNLQTHYSLKNFVVLIQSGNLILNIPIIIYTIALLRTMLRAVLCCQRWTIILYILVCQIYQSSHQSTQSH